MNKEQHLKHLEQLEECTGMAIIKREGAFMFDSHFTAKEYASLYRQKCIELGWIK